MQFSRFQRNQIDLAMDEAEERTARYYCIPPHRRQDLRYDLLTSMDNEWEPLPDAALARIRCLEKLKKDRSAPLDFYRIELNDPSILTVATQENLGPDLYPFFVYILTHEMVHMIRLSTMITHEATSVPSTMEESRVARICRQILSQRGNVRLTPVLERFNAPL